MIIYYKKRKDDSNEIHLQQRCTFKLYKYRSMVMHADEKLWEYLNENPEAKEEFCKYKKNR